MRSLFQKCAFALANTVAVLVALYIAFARDLDRPYWAMFTVFIVAQPLSGAVRSKGIYRLFGSFAGALMALILVPPLVQAPALLCLAMAMWVGTCLYVALLDRTPRSYAFLLAGYTATIVGLSVVNSPEAIFDTAISRLEEISLGIVCGAVAHSIFFPQNVLEELNEKIASTLTECRSWLAEALAHPSSPPDHEASRRLSTVAIRLHLLYTHVAFETSDVPRAAPAMRALLDRLALLLPHFSNIQAASAALLAYGGMSPTTESLLRNSSRWIRTAASNGVGYDALRAELDAHSEMFRQEELTWPSLLECTIYRNLVTLVDAVEDSRILARAIEEPATPLPSRITISRSERRPLHRDRGLAFLSACAAAGATLLASAIWIETAWPEGAIAVQFAAISCSLFATLDRPAKVIGAAIVGILFALPIAAVYEFAILPQITGFESLALVLSPVLLIVSFMQTFEKLEGGALVLAIGFGGALALQSSYRADFAAFLNSNMAEIAGPLIAIGTILIFRTIDPAWNAMRISRAGWRSVIRLARDRTVLIRPWTLQMFDRLGLVSTRLSPAAQHEAQFDGLRDMRVGLDIAAIRDTEKDTPTSGGLLEAVRRLVAREYEALLARGSKTPAGDLVRAIDAGVTSLYPQRDGDAVLGGLAALTALRLDLAPDAPPYELPEAVV